MYATEHMQSWEIKRDFIKRLKCHNKLFESNLCILEHLIFFSEVLKGKNGFYSLTLLLIAEKNFVTVRLLLQLLKCLGRQGKLAQNYKSNKQFKKT